MALKRKWKRSVAYLLTCCMLASPVTTMTGHAEENEGSTSIQTGDVAVNSVTPGDADGSENTGDGISGQYQIYCDFESEEVGGVWGMTGGLIDTRNAIAITETDGNKYLAWKGAKGSTFDAVKTFEDMPRMKTATVKFKLYTTSLTTDSRSGYAAYCIKADGVNVLTLCHADLRDKDGDRTRALYYYTDSFDSKAELGKNAELNGSYDVEITFDFNAGTAAVAFDGTTLKEGIVLPKNINNINQFAFFGAGTLGSGKTFDANVGIDDFAIAYEEDNDADLTAIASVAELPEVTVDKAAWDAGYAHPTQATATLEDGATTITVDIDSTSWTAEPAFDAAVRGNYVWTADIIAPEGHANNKGAQAAYRMVYTGEADNSHDYSEDFALGIWSEVAWSKSMDSNSGTGTFKLAHKQDAAGNYYMQAGADNQGGERGSRLELNSEIIKGSKVSFDWMPISAASNSCGDLMFLAPGSWNSYFTLRFSEDCKITYITKCPLTASSTEQKEFAGSVDAVNAVDTGLGEANRWYTVNLDFDYVAHTADVTITDKEDASKTYTVSDLPIATEANGLLNFVAHLGRTVNADGTATTGKLTAYYGLDNIKIDYVNFTGIDVVSVEQPSDVSLAKADYEKFEFPTEVTVTMGDSTTKTLKAGTWTAAPVFDENKGGDYVWTAPLVLESGLENPFGLVATFAMNYSILPYPVYAHNPNTLELKPGEALPAFPERVTVFLNNGETSTMPIDNWEPIREFNAEEEGIYVYGAHVVAEEGKTELSDSITLVNEQHVIGEDTEKYTYDVYYRISYFETQDNYNAYTRSMEYLDRGVYAVKKDGGIFVSWRLLVTEYGENIQFNVYRNGQKVNADPITTKTNYLDVNGNVGDVYTIETIVNGGKTTSDGYAATDKDYISIPMQKPDPQDDGHGTLATYTLNDAGVADVDGDGEYEIIVKWYPSNAFDSGMAKTYSSPTIFDIYEMDGTPLWRLNMGLEMPSGAHFNQFMLYDLDEDGKAELLMKTSDGTVSYKPNAEGRFDMTDESTIVSYIGDKSVVPGSNVNSNGHVSADTNEYITVFNGQTGEEIDTIDYCFPTGEYTDWGTSGGGKNDGGNRSARYNIAVAYLPKDKSDASCTETIPAVLFNRGYYAKMTVAAYTLRDGKIQTEWTFNVDTGEDDAGKGNHNVATGDMDNDGFDEIVLGSIALDHDGTILWSKNGKNGQDFSGHGDTIHLAAMTPDSTQLYVFAPEEEKDSTVNYHLSNAGTGTRIAANFLGRADIGRGVAANITPTPGYEYWANRPSNEIAGAVPGAIYNFYGDVISQTKPDGFSTNFVLYWDGDLLSELFDSATAEGPGTVSKYNWEDNSVDVLELFEGTKLNNYTKNNPCLTVDLLGDWREEVLLRSEDDSELRIYMTTEDTDYMIYTLMHDPVYRNAVANQNTSYNQPAHVGFYLGEDVRDEVLAMQLPTAKVAYTTEAPTPEPIPVPTPDDSNTSEDNASDNNEDSDDAGSTEQPAAEVKVDWNQVNSTLSGNGQKADKDGNISLVTGNKIEVPAASLDSLKKSGNKTLVMHTGTGLAFSISGKNITNSASGKTLNLAIREGQFQVSAQEVAEKTKNAVAMKTISMANHESFGMVVNLHMNLGKENSGKFANFYRKNDATGKLEYMGCFKITQAGQAMYGMTRGGEYLVTVTNAQVAEKAVAGDSYRVMSGDTLSSIARRYGVSLSELLKLNPEIRSANMIRVNQQIRLY